MPSDADWVPGPVLPYGTRTLETQLCVGGQQTSWCWQRQGGLSEFLLFGLSAVTGCLVCPIERWRRGTRLGRQWACSVLVLLTWAAGGVHMEPQRVLGVGDTGIMATLGLLVVGGVGLVKPALGAQHLILDGHRKQRVSLPSAPPSSLRSHTSSGLLAEP